VNAVEFERVSKSYSIYEAPGDRLKELLTFGRCTFHREFHAVRDVSFSIGRGEVFCIVGENGSGKSTTLQLMAGIMQPSSGDVRVEGRVSALLELGSGFNPEFTGRDNVYLNASILGISKREIGRRYREIEEFAEIGGFIDQPVKTYSSGMVMRLAFAVAIHVDPEILLVDEALAVGDAYFRHRCFRKVHELRARGVTIVFVSHGLADIKAIGDRVLWLEHGSVTALGDPETVLTQYLEAMSAKEDRYRSKEGAGAATAIATGESLPDDTVEAVRSIPNVDHRHGDGRAEILGVAVLNEYGEPVHLMTPGSRILVRISVKANEPLAMPVAGFMLRNHLGIDFAETNTAREGRSLPPMRANEVCTVDFHVDIPEFYPGAFSFSPYIACGTTGDLFESRTICDWVDNAVTVQMGRGEGPVYGYIQLPCKIELAAPARGIAPLEPMESRLA
jgi:ABC-type polysaccharide/polyol phosphate transport system ATPase subunit